MAAHGTSLVEGAHNETQKVMGMLVKDIMQCLPNECGELQYVVEFVVYNTPGPHGYTPRDIDRRWSLATPLERELQPFTVSEFEPVSEYVANLFRNYREIRVRVLGWLHASSTKRAELANRFRTSKKVLPGMQVVLRDPRHRKAGGRTPYRQPYSDPSEVLEVHGNKCTIRRPDGTVVKEVHLEDVMIVPENSKHLESRDITFEDDDELELSGGDSLDRRRSPGMMLEDQGRAVEDQKEHQPMKPGKLEKLVSGNHIVYRTDDRRRKLVLVGKILNISKREAKVVVHKYYPVSDHRLRLRWVPVFVEQGSEVLGSGSRTSEEQVAVNRIICTTQLHDGVIAHAVARRLDLAGYSFDEDAFKYDAPVNAAIVQDQEQLVHKAALFCTSGSQVPKLNSPLQRENMELRKWLSLKRVDFAEIYRGFGEFTIRVREGGRTAAEGFDNAAITYERTWHLDRHEDQADLAWLLCYVLKPKVVHLGTPCTKMCVLGKQQIDHATEMQNEFTRKVMLHQQAHSWKASVEQPKGSILYEQPKFVEHFGRIDDPKAPWKWYLSHGCQLQVIYPGEDDPGCPIHKASHWMANFDLSGLELRCTCPFALMPASHTHKHARGTMTVGGVRNIGVANFTGKYTGPQGAVYAKSVAGTIKNLPENPKPVDTELRRLAACSKVATSQPDLQRSVADPEVGAAAFCQLELTATF